MGQIAPLGVLGVGQQRSGGGFHLSGTTSLSGTTIISLARDICYSLIEDGARKIVFMNGHYENYQFIFEGAELVYADCNLSVDMLAVLSQRCTQWGIPFFIAGVSEEKTLRAVQVLRNGGACDGLFLNRREADYVKKHLHDMHPRASVISKTLEDMNFGEYLRCKVVITEGAEGAVLVEDSQIYRVRAPTVEGVRTLLGAGDAFMAGTLVHFVQERSTLYRALDRAALTARSEELV